MASSETARSSDLQTRQAHHSRKPWSKGSTILRGSNAPTKIGYAAISPLLGEYPKPMVRMICSRCDRKGQYRKETLIALCGPDVTMPDLRHLIAKCERNGECCRGISAARICWRSHAAMAGQCRLCPQKHANASTVELAVNNRHLSTRYTRQNVCETPTRA